MAKKNTAAIAEELAAPILEEMGLQLWDVVYEKEGSGWYLRYYVDKEGGIDINSCEAFSRAISDVLDEADPIDGSYTLEVSSPGIERALTRDWHFEALMGQQLLVRLIRPVEGVRDFIGTSCSVSGRGISTPGPTVKSRPIKSHSPRIYCTGSPVARRRSSARYSSRSACG